MAMEIAGFSFSRPAAADLSLKQFHFGQVDTNGDIAAIASQGVVCDGVIQNKPDTAGQAAVLMTSGISKVVAGEAIGDGIEITPGNDGRAEIALTGDFVCGKTIEAAGADGEVIGVLLFLNRSAAHA